MYLKIGITFMMITSMIITACKQTDHLDPASLGSANDQVKIAVNYLGDVNCRKYLEKVLVNNKEESDDEEEGNDAINKKINEVIEKNKGSKSHLLNGKDGELITENYRESTPNRENLRLSGDKFFDRKPTGNEPLTIETIEKNCRRLVLSVDSSRPPTITFEGENNHGFVAKKLEIKFLEDFSTGRQFGQMSCKGNFCKFSEINNGDRYFTYLEPASDHNDIVLGLSWSVGDEEKSEKTITLKNIRFKDETRYQDAAVDHRQNYVSHLYVALDKKQDNYSWTTQIGNPHFKVSLQTGADSAQLLQAEGQLKLNDRDLTKNVAKFKVATICLRLLDNKCEDDLSNLRQLLLDNDVKLLFGFWENIDSQVTEFQTHKLTESFIDDWIQRKGEIYFDNIDEPEWSNFRFIFTNPNQQNLYLSTTTTPTEQFRYQIKSLRANDCPEFKARFSPLTTAIINRRSLLDHLDNSKRKFFHNPFALKKCVTRKENDSDLEFLQKAGLTLSIKSNLETYKYTFTDESIDSWWREIGEITVTAETGDEGGSGESKTLVLGLQDRR